MASSLPEGNESQDYSHPNDVLPKYPSVEEIARLAAMISSREQDGNCEENVDEAIRLWQKSKFAIWSWMSEEFDDYHDLSRVVDLSNHLSLEGIQAVQQACTIKEVVDALWGVKKRECKRRWKRFEILSARSRELEDPISGKEAEVLALELAEFWDTRPDLEDPVDLKLAIRDLLSNTSFKAHERQDVFEDFLDHWVKQKRGLTALRDARKEAQESIDEWREGGLKKEIFLEFQRKFPIWWKRRKGQKSKRNLPK